MLDAGADEVARAQLRHGNATSSSLLSGCDRLRFDRRSRWQGQQALAAARDRRPGKEERVEQPAERAGVAAARVGGGERQPGADRLGECACVPGDQRVGGEFALAQRDRECLLELWAWDRAGAADAVADDADPLAGDAERVE